MIGDDGRSWFLGYYWMLVELGGFGLFMVEAVHVVNSLMLG